MTVNYTSLLGLALPVTGTEAGAWGDVVNNYLTSYLDASVAGTQTITGSQTAVTLAVTNGATLVTVGSGATGSAQFQIITCTGNPASLLTITAPASSRQYIIINSTSTSQSVKIVGAGPTTGVTIVSGEKAHVAWNGSDFVKIATQSGNGSFVDLTVSGNLTLSGGTQNGVLYLNASRVATSGSALTFNGSTLATSNANASFTSGSATTAGVITSGAAGSQGVIQFGSSQTTFNIQGGPDYLGMIYNAASALSHQWAIGGSEQMRLTSTGLGIGTSSPGYKLAVRVSGATTTLDGLSVSNGTASSIFQVTGATYSYRGVGSNNLWIGTDGGNDMYIGPSTANVIKFGSSAFEYMRLDSSGNLGIGTNNPTTKLDVSGQITTRGSVAAFIAEPRDGTGAVWSVYNPTGDDLRFFANSDDRLILTNASNLGLGVTPSAWGSYKAIQVNSLGISGSTGDGGISFNSFYNGSTWKFIADGQATLYNQYQGQHRFFNSNNVSGSAGGDWSPTQAMTLDASGNLVVGDTAATTGAKIDALGRVMSSNSNNDRIVITQAGRSVAPTLVDGGTALFGLGNGAAGITVVGDGVSVPLGIGTYGNEALILGTNNTERARITSGGDLLVGTTSVNAGYLVNPKMFCVGGAVPLILSNGDNTGTYLQFNTGAANGAVNIQADARTGAYPPLTFTTSATERARISADGTFRVKGAGTAGTTDAVQFSGSAPASAMTLDASGNLGIGETSPSTYGKITLKGGKFSLVTDTAAERRVSFWSTANGNSENAYIQVQNDGATTNTGEMLFATKNSGGTLAERARITAGGDFRVAWNNGSFAGFYFDSTYYQGLTNGTTNRELYIDSRSNDTRADIVFRTGLNTAVAERARITSGGNLLVGTTSELSSNYKLQVVGVTSGNGFYYQNSTDGGNAALFVNAAGSSVGYISVGASATTYNTTSDYRLKNNQQALTGSGAFIDALKPKTWDWKSGGKGVGFIAHEVAEVSPGTVVGTKDAVDEEGKPIMQAMEYGSAEFIANIIAELQSLRARVAQLEQGA